jgi:hypothetical protein
MSVQDDSLPGERFLPSDGQPFFAPDDVDVWELGPRQTAGGWLRLFLAAACLAAAGALTGHRFLQYVVHHVWDHSRNSPVALIVPVVAVEFLWLIAHVHTGGVLARLKIGLGALGMCMALFAPRAAGFIGRSEWNPGHGRSFDLVQLVALILTSWVFIDGWRDRNSNLRAAQSSPPPARLQ